MKEESKDKRIYFLEELKDFEAEGGNPKDYKEILVELRNAITSSLSKEDDKRQTFFFMALEEIKYAIDTLDNVRLAENSDDVLKEGKVIEKLASNLLNKNAMIILDIMLKK